MMRYQILDNWVHLNSALINDKVELVNFGKESFTSKGLSSFSQKVISNQQMLQQIKPVIQRRDIMHSRIGSRYQASTDLSSSRL